MSLEAALADNTAALKEVASLLKEANEGRVAAVEALKGSAAGETVRKPRGRPAGSAASAEPAPAAQLKTPPEPQPAPQAGAPAAAELSIEDFRAKAGGFMTVSEPEKGRRQEFIRAVNDHLGIERLVQAEAADRGTILGWLERFAAGESVNFSDGEDAGGGNDGIG